MRLSSRFARLVLGRLGIEVFGVMSESTISGGRVEMSAVLHHVPMPLRSASMLDSRDRLELM